MKKLFSFPLCALIIVLTVISCTVEKPVTKEPAKTVIVTQENKNIQLDKGLVVHYKFDDAASPALDSSGRGNDGIVFPGKDLPMIDSSNPKIGAAVAKLDHNNTMFVNLNSDANFKPSSDDDGLTFSLWVYKTQKDTAINQVVMHTFDMAPDFTNGESEFYLSVDAPGEHKVAGYVYFSHPLSTDYHTYSIGQKWDSHADLPGTGKKTGALGINNWNHIVVVKDKRAWNMYINGIQVESTTYLSMTFFPAYFRIGQAIPTDGSFKGYIDDFRLYERALNMDEIQALAAQ